MKYLLALLFLSATTLAYGQSWEVGIATGSRLCINRFNWGYDGGDPQYLPNETTGETGIYFKYLIRKHWSFKVSMNYYRLTSSAFVRFNPIDRQYYNISSDIDGYNGTLINRNAESSLGFYYSFNNRGAKARLIIGRIKSSIGLSIGYVSDLQKYAATEYEIIQPPSAEYSYPVASQVSKSYEDYFLLGLNYIAEYQVSKRVNFNFALSFNKSTYFTFYDGPAIPSYFEPQTTHSFLYLYPDAFLSYKIGLGYTL